MYISTGITGSVNNAQLLMNRTYATPTPVTGLPERPDPLPMH